ncbi:MAG: O-antigen ligase family protein [Chitinispirillaceae bacterium]|nr:O-antigen ligase family protein [Chitinispirillaceae bacterium]
MTLALRFNWKYLAFFLFLAVTYRQFGEMFILIASLVFAIILSGLVIARKLRINIFATFIYIYLLFGSVNYLTGIAVLDFIFPFFLPLFPLFLLHYIFKVNKKIPAAFPFLIMLAGLFVSIIYQTVRHKGVYEISFFGDQWFIFEIVFFFSVYMLFPLRILSLWNMVVMIALSSFFEIVYVFLKYFLSGSAGAIFTERFGSSLGFTSNQIATWIEVAFPLALFIGLYDKRPRIKWTFLVVAVFYGTAILLSASRASLIGLPLIPLFIAANTKSVSFRVAVVVVSLAATGVFGRGAIQRVMFPSQGDKISSLGRVELLKAAHGILKANCYFFGIGMDNYKGEKYRYGFMRSYDPKDSMSTHNGFLEIWLGWGLPGFVGWLMFLSQCVLRTIRAPLRPELAYLKPALLLSFSCSLIHSLFDSTIACFPFMIFFLTLCACMSYLCECEEVCRPLSENEAPTGGITPRYAAVP